MLELCSIASGSSGNCICIGSSDTHVLVDAGISGKRIEEGLHQIDMTGADMDGILITHEHSDHIAGLGVIAKKFGIPIYATEGTIEAILQMKLAQGIDRSLFHPIHNEETFLVGNLEIEAVPVSHDAADPVAYKVTCGTYHAGVLTDLGCYNDQTVEHFRQMDMLLLEANHDIHMLQAGKYPYRLKQRILGNLGHLSNESSGQLLGQLLHDHFGTVLLGHLSKENNYEALAYETVRLEVTLGDNPYHADDFPIYIAHRDTPSPIIRAE